MKAAVIANPRAGWGRAVERARQAMCELKSVGIECELACSDGAGSAAALARAYAGAGCELVFAAGGDGTINEVVQGIVGSGAVLGLVPAGLANVWAAEVGLRVVPGAFAALVRHGLVFDTDLGAINGRYFLLMAGIGFDAEVAAAVKPQVKARWAQLAYVRQAIASAARWKPVMARVSVGDRSFTLRLFGAVAANASRYAGVFELSRDSRLDDGLLELIVYQDRGFARRLRSMLLAGGRTRRWDPCASTFSTSEARISTLTPLPLHTDAEPAGSTPCRITVASRVLPVLLPPEAAVRYVRQGRPPSFRAAP